MKWWVYTPRHRLALPVDMPRLDINEAIARGWTLELRGNFLLPNPVEYLPTYPLPASWTYQRPPGEWFPHDPTPLIVRMPRL